MSQSFLDLQNEVKRRAFKDESGTTFDTAAQNLINFSILRIAREAPWIQLRRTSTIATVASTESYNLPLDFGRQGFFWHTTFGYPYTLQYVPTPWFYDSGVDTSSLTATPTHYRLWNTNTVLTQPSSASVLRIASSSSSDTSKTVRIIGIVSGYPDTETIITDGTDGTTAVSGLKSFTSVERISCSASRTGRITVDSNSAAVTVAVLPVGNTGDAFWYQKIQLWPIPNAAITLNTYYYKQPPRLVNDQDVCELGPDFDECIVLCATMKALQSERQKEDSDRFYSDYTQELQNLKRFYMDNLDWLPHPVRRFANNKDRFRSGLKYSQLGASYGPTA